MTGEGLTADDGEAFRAEDLAVEAEQNLADREAMTAPVESVDAVHPREPRTFQRLVDLVTLPQPLGRRTSEWFEGTRTNVTGDLPDSWFPRRK